MFTGLHKRPDQMGSENSQIYTSSDWSEHTQIQLEFSFGVTRNTSSFQHATHDLQVIPAFLTKSSEYVEFNQCDLFGVFFVLFVEQPA